MPAQGWAGKGLTLHSPPLRAATIVQAVASGCSQLSAASSPARLVVGLVLILILPAIVCIARLALAVAEQALLQARKPIHA
jgi:hypothetical protein